MPNAVITGAASGMGRLALERLVAAGWTVAAVDLMSPALDELDSVDGVFIYPCDVRDLLQVQAAAAAILESLGRVDRLVTAAGIAVVGRIGTVPTDRFLQAMDVNYAGTVAWVNELLPALHASSGELVLFASLAGWIVTPGYGAYTASKFAVVGFAETLAEEARGTGLTIRCVCPPGVRTPMLEGIVRDGHDARLVEVSRPLRPEQVLDAIDRSLQRRQRRPWVFPGPAGFVWRVRRVFPSLVNAAGRRLGA